MNILIEKQMSARLIFLGALILAMCACTTVALAQGTEGHGGGSSGGSGGSSGDSGGDGGYGLGPTGISGLGLSAAQDTANDMNSRGNIDTDGRATVSSDGQGGFSVGISGVGLGGGDTGGGTSVNSCPSGYTNRCTGSGKARACSCTANPAPTCASNQGQSCTSCWT